MSGKSFSQSQVVSRSKVIKLLLDKDDMRYNASPKLVEAVERTYSLMSNEKLEEMYWYCYHKEVTVED